MVEPLDGTYDRFRSMTTLALAASARTKCRGTSPLVATSMVVMPLPASVGKPTE
ncbi:Uncharacterised protein [Mycobacterium tuberculosis]|nr:Uncharacterised protein [Mycobacterium tuberculosis]